MTDPTPYNKRSPLEHERDEDDLVTRLRKAAEKRDGFDAVYLATPAADLIVDLGEDLLDLSAAYEALQGELKAAKASVTELEAALDSHHAEVGKKFWRWWRDEARKHLAGKKAAEARIAELERERDTAAVKRTAWELEAKILRGRVAELEEQVNTAMMVGHDLAKEEYRDRIAELELALRSEEALREWNVREWKARDKDRIAELEYEKSLLFAMLKSLAEADPPQPDLPQQRVDNERLRDILRQARLDAEEAQDAIAGILDVINDALEPNQGDDEC